MAQAFNPICLLSSFCLLSLVGVELKLGRSLVEDQGDGTLGR